MPNSEDIMMASALATEREESAPELLKILTQEEKDRMMYVTKKMQLSSVTNFPYYIVNIKDLGLSFTHQWVRHRHMANMQRSYRYSTKDPKIENNELWFIVPKEILKTGADSVVKYIKGCSKQGGLYLDLLKKGAPNEDAREVLPTGTKTHISTAMCTEEAKRVIIKQRTCFDSQWHINSAAYCLYAGGYLVSPNTFNGAGPHCIYEERTLGRGIKARERTEEFINKLKNEFPEKSEEFSLYEKEMNEIIDADLCLGRGKGKCKKRAEEIIDKLNKKIDDKREEFEALERYETLSINLSDILGYKAPKSLAEEVSQKLGLEETLNLDYPVILDVIKN